MENQKNSIVQIDYKTSDNTQYGVLFDGIRDRGNNYIIEPGKTVNVQFEDEYCVYKVIINNVAFNPKYSITAGYNTATEKCIIGTKDESVKKFLTFSTEQKGVYKTSIDTGSPSMFMIGLGLLVFLFLGIIFMNKKLNKKEKYITIN